MAAAPGDLLAPAGAVQPSFFPNDDAAALTARLQAYLTDGEAQAQPIADADAHDQAVVAWAYYRAFTELADRLDTTPTTVELSDQGSRSYLVTQLENVRKRAASYRATFDALLLAAAVEGDTVVARPPVPATASVPVTFVW